MSAKITHSIIKEVYKLCLLGATNAEIADFFDITESELEGWKEDSHKFRKAIKLGKMSADAKVSASLYKRACGYTYTEEKAFSYMGDVEITSVKRHMPADVNAAKFWLKNRQRDKWKEAPETQQVPVREPWEIEYTEE